MTRQYDHENFVKNFVAKIEQFAKTAHETGNGKILKCRYSLEFTNYNGDPKFSGEFVCPIIEKDD